MKYTVFLFSLLLISLYGQSQNVSFSNRDDKKMVLKGAKIDIEADTAYIISKRQALRLNEQLDKLDTISNMYNTLLGDRNELVEEIQHTQKSLQKLRERMEADSAYLTEQMALILNDLEKALEDLRITNQTLKDRNSYLEKKLKELDHLIADLEKETSKIWWSATVDRIVAFGAGLGVGIIVGVLL